MLIASGSAVLLFLIIAIIATSMVVSSAENGSYNANNTITGVFGLLVL
jgi:hypothetical protein